jgi:hypothetical protein
MHIRTGGLPLMFLHDKVESYVQGVRDGGNTIVDADYETALRNYGV